MPPVAKIPHLRENGLEAIGLSILTVVAIEQVVANTIN
jgi:hypothetical protein